MPSFPRAPRSTPLALALLRQPAIACRVVIDGAARPVRRLGIAKASGVPALVLGTSGSAPRPLAAGGDRGRPGRRTADSVSADRPWVNSGPAVPTRPSISRDSSPACSATAISGISHPDFCRRVAPPACGPRGRNQLLATGRTRAGEPTLPRAKLPPGTMPSTLAPLPAMHPPANPGRAGVRDVVAVAATVAGAPGSSCCRGHGPAPVAIPLSVRPHRPRPQARLPGDRRTPRQPALRPHDRGLVCGHQDRWLRGRFSSPPIVPPGYCASASPLSTAGSRSLHSQAPEVIVVEERPALERSCPHRRDPGSLGTCRLLLCLPQPFRRSPGRIGSQPGVTAEAGGEGSFGNPPSLPKPESFRLSSPPCRRELRSLHPGNSLPIRDVDSFFRQLRQGH